MKSDALRPTTPIYTEAAPDTLRTASPELRSAPPSRRPSVSQRPGSLERQLREAMSEGSPEGAGSATQGPALSPVSVTGHVEMSTPATLEAHSQALTIIKNESLQYVREHWPQQQALFRSWPDRKPFAEVEDQVVSYTQEAVDHSGYQELGLPLTDHLTAQDNENRMVEEVKEEVQRLCQAEGWLMKLPPNMKWNSLSPMTAVHGLELDQLKPNTTLSASAGRHSTVTFATANLQPGQQAEQYGLALKQANYEGFLPAIREAETYKKIVDSVGLHPNMMVPLGLLSLKGNTYLALEAVPGCDGGAFLKRLHQHLQGGKLSETDSEEVLALVLDRGLSFIAHCHAASICVNDIKPDNMRFNENTGEPIFGDLGLSCEENSPAGGYTHHYSPPEARTQAQRDGEHVDHRSDMFGLAASLADSAGGGSLMYRHSPQGRVDVMPNLVDADEQKRAGTFRHPADDPKTPLWKLIARLMHEELDGQRNTHPDKRMPLDRAREELAELRKNHDENRVLGIMKRLSHDAAKQHAEPAV